MVSEQAKRPTINDVADRAGVSKSLVSLVMQESPNVSDEKRSAVLEAARELGYRPNAMARSLVRQRTGVLGTVLSDLHNPFFSAIVHGIEDESISTGNRALLSSSYMDPGREAAAIDSLMQLQVDGLIMLGTVTVEEDVEEAASLVPVVMVGRHVEIESMDSVSNDDFAGAGLVVDHLVGLGHRRIAHVHAGALPGARPRRLGYEAAMRAHGLADEIRIVEGSFTEEAGERATRQILESGDLPTALFVANDYAALGALQEFDEAGLDVPGDISLVGYDNLTLSQIRRISMTTVDQPRYEMGRLAASLVFERLDEGRTEARHILMPPEIIARDTTGPPRTAVEDE